MVVLLRDTLSVITPIRALHVRPTLVRYGDRLAKALRHLIRRLLDRMVAVIYVIHLCSQHFLQGWRTRRLLLLTLLDLPDLLLSLLAEQLEVLRVAILHTLSAGEMGPVDFAEVEVAGAWLPLSDAGEECGHELLVGVHVSALAGPALI